MWVPKNRPRTEREARQRAEHNGQVEDAPAAGSELADRWKHEDPWTGGLVTLPGRPVDECGECDGPLLWEPGRTVIYCRECKRLGLPTAVTEHYQRQSQRGAEVAVRAEPDAAAVRAARVRLRALIARTADGLAEWLDVFDPADLNGGPARLALDYRAELAAYLPEIKGAADEHELAEIMADVDEVIERARTSGALDQIGRQRDVIERQAEQAEREAEWAEQAEQEARQAEQAEREAQRRAEIEARSQRKAIASPASSNGYIGAGVMLIGMVEKYRADKERKLSQYGRCGYEHKKPAVPERRYWIATVDFEGNQTGYELPNAPSAVVCKKHFALADQWIEEQAALLRTQQFAQVKAVYTELT